MKANCVAPVKTSSDIAHACGTLSPLVTASAPNDAPYTPVAMPTPRLSRTTARLSCGSTSSRSAGTRPPYEGGSPVTPPGS